MNRFAYLTTGLAIRTLAGLSKARVHLHGTDRIPRGPGIFVINHFTRVETLFLPVHIYDLTRLPVWSLADESLFTDTLAPLFDKVGVVSTADPHRDRLVVKTLLTGEASWIIYPEGEMVKNKKIIEHGRFMIAYAGGSHPPHTGAAALALRTEFYRQRIARTRIDDPAEAERILAHFDIGADLDPATNQAVHLIPVNITYYPVRARENLLSRLAARIKNDMPERFIEELMTEGNMLLSGVDIDIRFGTPIDVRPHLQDPRIQADIRSPGPINLEMPLQSRARMRKAALRIMQNYMSAIYGMTTVNHDHLFAALLQLSPFRRVRSTDLRSRAFLAARTDWPGQGIAIHHSLADNQIHLLTDDRFGKFKDFCAILAARNGNPAAHDDRTRPLELVKDATLFGRGIDFHRSRIDNPIAIMANETEPLIPLRRRLRQLAWMPRWWIRRCVVRTLIQEEQNRFEADYQKFAVDGESHPPKVGRPFLLKGRRRDIGVVLIHGYMAAPMEMRELAEPLNGFGFPVYAPRLAGHGTSPADLGNRRFSEWIQAAENGYALINTLCRRVVVGGFSNGAGIALDLASRLPDTAGVVAIAPPLQLQDMSAKLVPAMDAWNRMMALVKLETARKPFVDNAPENPRINYHRNPISGVHQLERLMAAVQSRLPAITVPALIVQADQDPVVHPDGSKKVYDRLGSTDKTYVLVNFKRHGIIRGDGAIRVHRLVAGFLEQTACKRTTPSGDAATGPERPGQP